MDADYPPFSFLPGIAVDCKFAAGSLKEEGVQWYNLMLGILAVWRLTHLLNAEDGPWDCFVRIRVNAGEGFWGRLLDCFYCLSLWVAVPFAIFLGERWDKRVLLWLGFSGGAILLERLTDVHAPIAVPYREEREEVHELLRQKESEPGGSVEPKA